MAKYTAKDADIKKLTESQKQDYNSFLLNYDVDSFQQANQGIDVITKKNSKYATMQGVINLLFLVPITIAIIVIVLYCIAFGIYVYNGKVVMNPKISFFIATCGLFVIFLVILGVIIYVLYDAIVSRMTDVKKIL